MRKIAPGVCAFFLTLAQTYSIINPICGNVIPHCPDGSADDKEHDRLRQV